MTKLKKNNAVSKENEAAVGYSRSSAFLKNNAIWLVLVVLVIVFSLLNHRFISTDNLLTMVRQVAVWGIAAVGMTCVILLGDIDLSTGSLISFVQILCAQLMVNAGIGIVPAVIITLLVAIGIGLINGFMVSTVGIPALIATFAMQTALAGITMIMSDGLPISGLPDSFAFLGQGKIGGVVPVPIVIMAICFVFGIFFLTKTSYGRYLYAVGGNKEAARLSGIRTGRVKYMAFAMSSFFAAIAGIVLLSRTMSGQPNAGEGYEFDVITCVVLGGISVNGGYGKLSGVLAGVLIIGALNNGMVLLNINTWVQDIVLGVVLVLAVGFDCISRRRQKN